MFEPCVHCGMNVYEIEVREGKEVPVTMSQRKQKVAAIMQQKSMAKIMKRN